MPGERGSARVRARASGRCECAGRDRGRKAVMYDGGAKQRCEGFVDV